MRSVPQHGLPEREGPFFLGGTISLAEVVTAPFMLRILDTLPELRGLDVLALCDKWGCRRLGVWVKAIASRPKGAAQFQVDREYVVKMARKMWVCWESADGGPGHEIHPDLQPISSGSGPGATAPPVAGAQSGAGASGVSASGSGPQPAAS